MAEAFHATLQSPFDPAQLAGLALDDWDRARLIVQPGVARLASDWPILDIWEARERRRPRSTSSWSTAPSACWCPAAAGDAPPPLADWFARWAATGLFTRCDIA